MEVVLGRTLDVEDLYATPDDGNTYEILDGSFVVSPPPGTRHQRVVLYLSMALHAAAEPRGLHVLPSPVAWRIRPGQVPEPDLIVASPEIISERAVEGPPALVVEVVSRSGRGRDLYEKRRIYAEGRAGWYWLVDPDEPSLTVLRLAGDAYVDHVRVSGQEAYDSDEPFPIRVVPADLLG